MGILYRHGNDPRIHLRFRMEALAMMFTKSFNLEHAKAGAPVCVNGGAVELLTLTRNDPRPIVVMHPSGDIETFHLDGTGQPRSGVALQMAPLCMLHGKPVFVGDALELLGHGMWEPFTARASLRDMPENRYRWPVPKNDWPKSTMTDEEMFGCSNNTKSFRHCMRSACNAAIAHACETGQVIPAKDIDLVGVADQMRDAILKLVNTERMNWPEAQSVDKVLLKLLDAVSKIDAGAFK